MARAGGMGMGIRGIAQETNLDVGDVLASIIEEIGDLEDLPDGTSGGSVNVDGIDLDFRFHVLPNGVVSVGRITVRR